MAVTIKDVAREARVSVATVSRALNGHSNVTPETRDHVLGVAARLRFIPSEAARTLISRRTHTVGALLPDLHGEYFSELIRGIDLAARARGLHLLVSSSHGDAAEAAAALRAMNGRVDGLLVMSPHVNADFLWGNVPEGLPAVLMNTRVAEGKHSSFAVDNYGGAFAMVRHLVERGHKRIAFVAGPDSNFEAQERLRGYRAALAELLPEAHEDVLQGDFTQESGWRVGNQVVALTERPTAVFASNDMMAIGCLSAFNEAGLQVPRDIALAGFDDIPISRYVNPPLTTVRAQITELGALALDRLASSIEEPERIAVQHLTLRADLIVRQSTAAPMPSP
ncbi:MAG TPA: LacI family DNA-binding transcriptional regulator [Albitalea sp.]|nr:LacI family DNA-binding transcriptional regulator [Albitalea sp.]HJW12991.1 LacI family DNA-binding transcriptional regulator [Albitalea sp.]